MQKGWNAMTGTIATEFGTKLTNLEKFYIHENQMSGRIPTELGLLHKLKATYLFSNSFVGDIPTELGRCSDLENIRISLMDGITGPIPEEFYDLTKLTSFFIGYVT